MANGRWGEVGRQVAQQSRWPRGSAALPSEFGGRRPPLQRNADGTPRQSGAATSFSIKVRLTSFTPARVALRVPKWRGLFSVSPKNLDFEERTQTFFADVIGCEGVGEKVSWVRYAKNGGKKRGFGAEKRAGRAVFGWVMGV